MMIALGRAEGDDPNAGMLLHLTKRIETYLKRPVRRKGAET